jgi:VCBS repeat-containing protein
MAVDSAGNLYIADTSNNRIRKVDSTGTITTIAGDGVQGYGGDGGPAGAARLSVPKGIELDAAGNLYIADDGNNRVRRIGPAPTNHLPVATDDTYRTNEDSALTMAAPGVLSNDTDADGDPLTAVVANGPAHGTLTLNSNGSCIYTPAANYNGSDTFTYTIDDGHGGTATANVNITVTPVNDPPSFSKGPDPVIVSEDSGAYSAPWATGISAGPADENSQTLTFQITNNTNPGLFSAAPALAPNGTLTFTPASNANGSATITVVLRDSGGMANGGVYSSSSQTFVITVTPVNDPPVARNDVATTRKNTAVTIPVLSNDTDVDGNSLHVVLVSSTTSKGGTLTTTGTTITYKPKNGFTGTDSFNYKVNDGQVNSNVATVTVTVTK